jgi:hypothetical protein
MKTLWAKRIISFAAIVFFAVAAIILFKSNPQPWPPEDVRKITVGLNEAAAIGVPHDFLMRKEMRADNLALIEKVEQGTELSAAESTTYRALFQTTLQESQKFLSWFDAELSILPDQSMEISNNVNTMGIAGRHDHHDISARKNFAALLKTLADLNKADGSFARIKLANAAQKDLVDLISHMGVAPNTISVPYVPPENPWPNPELGEHFEAMMMAFKKAQFAAVNSAPYWQAVDEALSHYAALILAVQKQVQVHTSVWQRRIAGRFLAIQTLAPPVSIDRPLRRK